jgi:uncharacterized membrane protein YesL
MQNNSNFIDSMILIAIVIFFITTFYLIGTSVDFLLSSFNVKILYMNPTSLGIDTSSPSYLLLLLIGRMTYGILLVSIILFILMSIVVFASKMYSISYGKLNK